MKYCVHCGNELQEQQVVCLKCGAAASQKNDKFDGEEYSTKSKLACGLLQIFLGGFGVGRFYSGHTNLAVAQLLVTIFTCCIAGLWGFIDGIIILASDEFRDAQGKKMRD